MEFRRVLFRSWDRRKTVNLGNPNLLGIFRRPTPENALFALSEGRANPIVTTICFALSAAASGPLEVIRPRPAGKYVEVSSATHGSLKSPLKTFHNHPMSPQIGRAHV